MVVVAGLNIALHPQKPHVRTKVSMRPRIGIDNDLDSVVLPTCISAGSCKLDGVVTGNMRPKIVIFDHLDIFPTWAQAGARKPVGVNKSDMWIKVAVVYDFNIPLFLTWV